MTLNDTPLPADGTIVANTAVYGSSNAQTLTFNASYATIANTGSTLPILTTGLYHCE